MASSVHWWRRTCAQGGPIAIFPPYAHNRSRHRTLDTAALQSTL
ncbi:hypothetical protein I546_3374 [Mycobacterium kansasii 732]|nr:hypothetical protein I546_3374 [Mycobacterium kansasii 732]